MVRMSVRKLTVAGLCAQAAVTAALVIISAASGADLSYYLLAAAYALTGLLFLEIIYARVPSKKDELRSPDADRASKRIEGLLNTLPCALFAIGLDAKITYANKAAYALLGDNASEIKGRPLSSIISREHIDEADGHVRNALSGMTIRESELIVALADGATRPLSFSIAPIRDEDTITGCICVISDMGRQKALETVLHEARASEQEAVARLEKAESDIEEFAMMAIRREVKMREIRERLQSRVVHSGRRPV